MAGPNYYFQKLGTKEKPVETRNNQKSIDSAYNVYENKKKTLTKTINSQWD